MGSSFGKGLSKAGSSILGGGMGDTLSKGAMKLGADSFGDKFRAGVGGMNQMNSLLGMNGQEQAQPDQALTQLMQSLMQRRR